MAEKQLYAAVQLHVQSMLMLEREGLQAVGALQDVRSDLTKLRGALFYKILEELHCHLYNNGEYSHLMSYNYFTITFLHALYYDSVNTSDLVTLSMVDSEDIPTSGATGRLVNSMQPLSRRTMSIKGENHFSGPATADGITKTSSVGCSSFDGPDDDSSLGGGCGRKDSKSFSCEIPIFLSCATPDEFLESMRKADAPLNVKYLRTLVQCLSMLRKVAAAGAVIWWWAWHRRPPSVDVGKPDAYVVTLSDNGAENVAMYAVTLPAVGGHGEAGHNPLPLSTMLLTVPVALPPPPFSPHLSHRRQTRRLPNAASKTFVSVAMTSLRLVIVVLTDQLFNIEVFDLYVDTNDFIEEYVEEFHVSGHTCQGTYRFMEHSGESQRVRPTIHDVITSKIKSYAREASKSNIDKVAKRTASDLSHSHGAVTCYQLPKQKKKNEASTLATQLVASPISPVMAPTGDAQHAASQLLGSIFECLVGILENHITVGELLEQKSSTDVDSVNTPHGANGDTSWNPDSEYSQPTGGFSVAFSLSVVQWFYSPKGIRDGKGFGEPLIPTQSPRMDQKAFLLLFALQMQQSLRKMKVKDGEETQLYPKKGMEQQASYLIKGFS
uniref:Exocyst complex component Sec8 n=1 Tax=Aegilops tauschii TaxID=37682 RepID=N1R0S2_AEGTA